MTNKIILIIDVNRLVINAGIVIIKYFEGKISENNFFLPLVLTKPIIVTTINATSTIILIKTFFFPY